MAMPMLYRLKRQWEAYLRIPQDARERKLRHLDRFLQLLLSAVSKQKDSHDPVPKFSDMKSVSNILAGEFLVDIHHICSTSQDDDITQLQEYLLAGRGAVLLRVLNTIGVEGLSCARELGDLLMSLLPLCCKFAMTDQQSTPEVQLEGMESCFTHLLSMPVSPMLSKFPTLTEVSPHPTQATTPTPQPRSSSDRLQAEWSQIQYMRKKTLQNSQADSAHSSSSENEEETENGYQSHRYRRHPTSPLLKLNNSLPLGVFPGLLQGDAKNETEDDIDLSTDDECHGKHLSPLELCLLLLNLVRNLCHGDCNQLMQTKAVSLTILPNLVQFLRNLHTDWNDSNECEIAQGWTREHVSVLQCFLVRVVVTVSSYVSLQSNGLPFLNSSGAILTLLTVAKQCLQSVTEFGLPSNIDNAFSSPAMKELVLAHDILYGTWLLLHTIFHGIPLNPSFLNNALKLLYEVYNHHGLQMVQKVLLQWERYYMQLKESSKEGKYVKDQMTNLVSSVGKVMGSLKKAKIDYIHTMKCMKRKHRNCEFSHYLHHHHDILGISAATFGENHLACGSGDSYGSLEVLPTDTGRGNQQECGVALLGDFLLRLFKESRSRLLQVRTLCCVEEAGLCCCMVPNRIMRLLIQNLEEHTPGMRNYILCILTKSLMDYCGGSAAVQKQGSSFCAVCRDSPASRKSSESGISTSGEKQRFHMSSQEVDSALSSDTSSQDDNLAKHPKWRCLRQFLLLVKNDNEAVSIQVTQHLLRIVSQGSPVFKQELFYCVFLPLLQAMKEIFPNTGLKNIDGTKNTRLSSSECLSKLANIPLAETVVQYCLSALPLLLYSRAAQDMFLNCGGLKQLSNLVQVRSFRRCVLKVFQVLIVMEDKRDQLLSPDGTTDPTSRWSFESQGHGTTDQDGDLELLATDGIYQTRTLHLSNEQYDKDDMLSSWMNVVETFSKLVFENGFIPPDTSSHSCRNDDGSEFESLKFECESESSEYLNKNMPGLKDKKDSSSLIPKERCELTIMCDIWSTCSVLFPYSKTFQHRFLENEGPKKAHDILLATLKLICETDLSGVDPGTLSHGKERGSEFQCWLSLLESTLLICLTCCSIGAVFKNQEILMPDLLQQVKYMLSSSSCLKGAALKAMCDTLLSCATTHRNMKDIVQNHTFAVMHLRIDDSDELEVQELSDYCSTAKESETCHTEQGYEADSEFTADEYAKVSSKGRLREALRVRGVRSATHVMLYPQVCRLVLELLLEHPDDIPPDGVAAHTLLKLISLAKQSVSIASALYDQGLVTILISGLKRIICSKETQVDMKESTVGGSSHPRVELHLILDLFLLISQQAFSSQELKYFLSLFHLDNAPVESLLSTAIALAETFQFQPTYTITFPALRNDLRTDLDFSVRSVTSDILTASIRQVAPSSDDVHSEYRQLLRSSSVQEAIEIEPPHIVDYGCGRQGNGPSALSCAPIQMTLRDNGIWPTNQKGFSMSMWLRLEGTNEEFCMFTRRIRKGGKMGSFRESTSAEQSTMLSVNKKLPPRLKAALRNSALNRHWSESCLHVVSLGSKQLRLEVWVDPENAGIICRLVGKGADHDQEILSEACIPHLLVFTRWQHMAVSITEQYYTHRSNVNVSVIVDGCYNKEVVLDYNPKVTLGGITDNDSQLLIGHSMSAHQRDRPTGNWQLGNFMLFRDSVLTKHTCFHLCALGPDCVTISQCDSSEQIAEYSHYVTHEAVFHSGLSHDVFTGNHTIYLAHLRENLVLNYSPQQASSYNLYNQPSPFKQATGSIRNILNSRDSQRSVFNPLIHHPTAVPVRMLMDVASQVHKGLSNAVDEIGGISVFLFLFAKVLEQSESEKQQSRALRLLFTLIGHNPRHAQDMRSMGGYAMLAKAMAASKCTVGYDVLKVLLDAALTRPILRYDTASRSYQLNEDTSALIHDTTVITDLLLGWRVWEKADVQVWQMAFLAIELLLRDSHPNREFNVKQLQNVGIVSKMLVICMERIQDAYPSLPAPICQSIVNITHLMMGNPPDIHVVMTICDFLLLMHPAASTYVNHMPEQFYFMQKWGGLTMSRQFSGSYSATSSMTSTPLKSMLQSQSVYDMSEDLHALDNSESEDGPVTTRLKRSQSMPASPMVGKRKLFSGDLGDVNAKQSSNDSTPEHQMAAKLEGAAFKGVDYLDEEDEMNRPLEMESEQDKKKSHSSNWVSEPHLRKDESVCQSRVSNDSSAESGESQDSAIQPSFYIEVGSEKSMMSKKDRRTSLDEEFGRPVRGPAMKVSQMPLMSKATVKSADKAASSNKLSKIVGKIEKLDIKTELKVDTSSPPEFGPDMNGNHDSPQRSPRPTRPSSLSPPGGLYEGQEPKGSPASNSSDWQLYPNVDSMRSIPISMNSTQEVDAVDDGEKGLVIICSGMLELMCQVCVMLPEVDRRKLTRVILKPEVLLVMAHHNASTIRTAIIKLLDVYFHRASEDEIDLFMRIQGFHLLASQLHQHQATRPLVEACFTIMMGRPLTLDDDIDTNMLMEMTKMQKLAVIPILSLLESSVCETALCHNTICLLLQIFENVPDMVPVMLDSCILETLCNVVQAINRAEPRFTDLGTDERQLLLEDVQHFYSIITEKTFSTSGPTHYQYLEDCMTLLYGLEQRETDSYGVNSDEVGNVRNIQCNVLRAIFDFVTSRLEAPPTTFFPLRKTLSSKVSSLLSKLDSRHFDSGLYEESAGKESWKRSNRLPSAPSHLGSARRSSFVSGLRAKVRPRAKSRVDNPVLQENDVFSSSFSTPGLLGNRKTEVSQSELLERFKKVVNLSIDFILFTTPRMTMTSCSEQRLAALVDEDIEIIPFEKDFARYMLEFLIRGMMMGMERSFFQKKTLSNTLMWQAKDVLRLQFARLLTHMFAPQEDLAQRLFALELLANESKCKELLKMTVHISGTGQKLVHFVYNLLRENLESLTHAHRDEAEEVMIVLQQVGFSPIKLGTRITPDFENSMREDLKLWEVEHQREKSLWIKRKETSKHRLMHKSDSVGKRISGHAMEVTQSVVHSQNQQRRKFVEHIKDTMTSGLQTKKAWQQLIQQLTHERAVWHDSKSYPKSWQLDPTEGPFRVRRRLQRCHLGVKEKFLSKEYKSKLQAEHFDPPLSFLFEDDMQTSDSAALIYRLHTNEKIEHTSRCTSVTPSSETPGELLIGQSSLYFVGDEAITDANYTQVLLGNRDLLSMTLPHEDIKEIHKRWWQLKDNALEIFLTNGKTCLLGFHTTRERDQVHRLLDLLDLPNLIKGENLGAIQQMWQDGRISNFEYLTHLNKMAGRSFNDLMQYPVFPFVLRTYDGETLNLDDPSSYRNLAKPIAVQHKEREEKYIENYMWLQVEKEKTVSVEEELEYHPEPYHYGSHYSNSGTVLHFLVRLPPFTKMFLTYQDHNFDLPDRTFHCMQTAWRLASFQSTTDVKELIPEFFFLPEFLTNFEGYHFGTRQTGEQVWDVKLPQWSDKDARLFTLINRQALESDYVTQNLPHWIDLVFGFKQTGKAAIDAINVFHPATYFGINVDNVEDSVRRTAIKTMIKTYGQTPKQLFKSPHPPSLNKNMGDKKYTISEGKKRPLDSVYGLRWGVYVGSPDCADPIMVWSQPHGSMVASLVALPTGEVFGLGANSHLLVMYSKEKGVTAVNSTDVLWAAIVRWGHPDNIVRVTNRKNAPPVNFLHWQTDEQVTCCASIPDCRLLFFGGTSGIISVFNTKFNSDKPSDLQVFGHRQCLYGHAGPVTGLYVCRPYSVMVSTSHDNTAIIWDLNRLSYVRTISDHTDPIKTVCVSETSGDIATVSHSHVGSCLKLHTINAQQVATVHTDEIISCLAFSNTPEGRTVSMIAGGLSNGVIRMWSSWDLCHVRDIRCDSFTRPVVSLTFTHDSQRLYASNIDGTVMMWERPSVGRTRPINFIPFL